MITRKSVKTIDQIKLQYDRIFRLYFKYEKGTQKMWQKVEQICTPILMRMSY